VDPDSASHQSVDHLYPRLELELAERRQDLNAVPFALPDDPLTKLLVAHLGGSEILGTFGLVARHDDVEILQILDSEFLDHVGSFPIWRQSAGRIA